MQKTLRINLLARNQAVKRARKQKARQSFDNWKEYEQRDEAQERKLRTYRNEERAHRHEDWKLGPLAPNRAVGKEKGKFGTIMYELASNTPIPSNGRSMPLLPGYNKMSSEGVDERVPRFKGKTIVGNVVVGDRVVIVQGPAKVCGQIGIVSSVSKEAEEVRISNVNIVDVEKPAPMMPEPSKDDPNPEQFMAQEGMIPMRNVRLVVRDKETKTQYIVSRLHADEPYIQRRFGSNFPSHTRYITGSEHWSKDGLPVEIPWPAEEESLDVRSTPYDTGRQDVEERTWDPSLYNSPLGYNIGYNSDSSDPQNAYLAGYAKNPSSTPNPTYTLGLAGFSSPAKVRDREARIASGIMDELRKKSARSNRNHDSPEWVTRKLMEDARSIWWKNRQIISPQELQAQQSNKEAQEEREARIRSISEKASAEKVEIKAQMITNTAALNALQRVEQSSILLPGSESKARILLDKDTEDLITQVQDSAQGSIYRVPTPKLRKKLKHMFPEMDDTTTTNDLTA